MRSHTIWVDKLTSVFMWVHAREALMLAQLALQWNLDHGTLTMRASRR